MKNSLLLVLAAFGLVSNSAQAAPTNDNFANRTVLSGSSPVGTASSVGATTEAGEPSDSGTYTTWWSYTPSANGRLTITTVGSTVNSPQIAAFLGTSIASLRLVASGNNYSTNPATMGFPVTAGTDYKISFGSYSNNTGNQILSLSLNTDADVSSLNIPNPATMANDNFASRIALAGDSVSGIAYNSTATTEAGEPSDSGSGTFWWSYTPSANGRLTVATQGSSVGSPQIAIYMGGAVQSLRLVASASNYGTNVASTTFPVSAGIDYKISFGSYSGGSGSEVLNLSLDKAGDIAALNLPNQVTMANDNFASRIALVGDTVSGIAYSPTATTEVDEPSASGNNTFWWSYTASATGRLTITTQGSSVSSPQVAVYMGATLQSLRLVSSASAYGTGVVSIGFPVTGGVDYKISFGSYNNGTGNQVLNVSLDKTDDVASLNLPNKVTMANDNFAGRVALVGDTVSGLAYNASGTIEIDEPPASGNNTFWWSYTPSANGRLTIITQGSTVSSPQVAVYLGSSLQSLKQVAGASAYGTGVASTSFPVTAGTDYKISFGSYNNGTGIETLNLSLAKGQGIDVSALNIPNAATFANDAFAGRVVLAGTNISAIGYTLGATREAFEPTESNQRTLWWSWTSSLTGTVELDFTGSDISGVTVGVWQGPSLSSLPSSPVALTPLKNSKTSFSAEAGHTYQISTGTPSTNTSGTAVVMSILGPAMKPVFGTALPSSLLGVGESLSLGGSAGAGATYRWQRNGVFITGATASTYVLPAVALANAGAYRAEAKNNLGTTLSAAANVAVMDVAAHAVTGNEGSTMSLTLPVAGPAGTLTYRWMRNGLDMADGKTGAQTISGSGTATLSITSFTSAYTGTYSCRVTLVNAADSTTPLTRTSGDFTVGISLKPVVLNAQPPAAEVARAFSWQLSASNNPASFTATGLPAGLALNSLTGLITGTPTAGSAGVSVNVTASNAAGKSAVQNFVLPIASIRAGLAGAYAGIIERDAVLNASLGGTLTTTIATSGAVTGTLRLGTLSYPLSGRAVVPPLGNATADITIPRPGKTPLTLSLVFAGDGSVNGSLGDGSVSLAVTAAVNPWSVVNQALALAGVYNTVLDLPAALVNDASVPQGYGFMQLTVVAKTGTVTVSGRTNDGVAFTSSGIVWADGRTPVFALLYSSKGSIRGLPQITAGDGRVGGSIDLQKTGPISAADHAYSTGFGPIDLVPEGSKWVKPAANAVVLGLVNQPGNFTVAFSQGGIEAVAQAGQISQTFQLQTNGTGKFATLANGNPAGVTMTVTTASGLFSGFFKLTDPKPGGTGTQTRLVSYFGILVPHLQQGFGEFMLPGLATGSDVLSGFVQAKAPPP